MGRGFKIIFTALFILMPVFFAKAMGEKEVKSIAEAKSSVSCSILDKIDEDESGLEKIPLKIGPRKYSYQESRISRNSDGTISSVKKVTMADFEKEIAFLLLNVETCKTEIIKVTKRGGNLIAPNGYNIKPVERASGLVWNAFNTQFEVISPALTIVLKNAWPKEETRVVITQKRGKDGKLKKSSQVQKYVKNIIYTLYSVDNPETVDLEPGIHLPEIVDGGSSRAKYIVDEARNTLRAKSVFSKAFPDQTVDDLPFLSSDTYERLILAEQTDYNEFIFDRRKTMERTLVILRANMERAFVSCNSKKLSKACGIFQFTDRWRTVRLRGKRVRIPGTYSTLVREYSGAGLIKNFPAGAFDHVNSAMAAILLHDSNLNLLVNVFGEQIFEDPVLLKEALAGCYNGSPRWTIMALEDYFDGKIDDWIESKHLRQETKEYIIKYRYAVENNLP